MFSQSLASFLQMNPSARALQVVTEALLAVLPVGNFLGVQSGLEQRCYKFLHSVCSVFTQGSGRANHSHGPKEGTSAATRQYVVLFNFFPDLAVPHCPGQALEAALSVLPLVRKGNGDALLISLRRNRPWHSVRSST